MSRSPAFEVRMSKVERMYGKEKMGLVVSRLWLLVLSRNA
jgi:hypothetical protein